MKLNYDSSPLHRGRRVTVSPRLFDQLPGSPRLWMSISVTCLIVAVVAVLRNHVDAAFVAATIGVVAWFVNVRNRLRAVYIEADGVEDQEGEENEDEGNAVREA